MTKINTDKKNKRRQKGKDRGLMAEDDGRPKWEPRVLIKTSELNHRKKRELTE
jgi:hypothetical protein